MTAIITNVKYSAQIKITANYSKEFAKNWVINTNDNSSFLQLRMLIHELLADGFTIEWK